MFIYLLAGEIGLYDDYLHVRYFLGGTLVSDVMEPEFD